jgi:hypothetical protein
MDGLPKLAMTLRDGMPRMTEEMIQRVTAHLETGCSHCRHNVGVMTRRAVPTGWFAVVQCDRCGRTVTNALPKAQHYEFQSYPVFDEDKRVHGEEIIAARRAETKVQSEFAARAARKETMQQYGQVEDYGEFLRSSPEWRAIRQKVLARARFICEACLSAQAEQVHHETYEFGSIPPAFLLHAVCRPCHERLHAIKLGKRDAWCPQSLISPSMPDDA